MPRCIENVIIIRIRIIITIDRKSQVVIFAVSFLQPKILWNIEIKVIVVIKHKHKIFDLRLVYVKYYCIGTLKMHNGSHEVVGPLPYHTWQSLAGSPHLTVLRFSMWWGFSASSLWHSFEFLKKDWYKYMYITTSRVWLIAYKMWYQLYG